LERDALTMPKITCEKPGLPTLWLDTAVGIKLAKLQNSEPQQEIETSRMVRLKELVVDRARSCRLLCPEGEQEYEFRGERLDNKISEEFATFSRGIRMMPHQAIYDSQAFIAMAVYVKGEAEFRIPSEIYFHSDPVAELRKIGQQRFFVSTSGLPPTLLEMNNESRVDQCKYFEDLRRENVIKNRTYLEQFALERKAFVTAMGRFFRLFRQSFLIGKVDPMDLFGWERVYRYICQWHRITGKRDDWNGLGDFLISDHFCELPAVKIASQLYAKLVTDKNRSIEPGDPMDVTHLASAVPVAHFVLTDRKMTNRIKELGIDKEWSCGVFSESTIDGLFAELEKI
jgi:hypothetical protein